MKIPAEILRKAAREILTGLGETPENSEKVSECLVKAEMRGVSTHGLYLLKVMSMRVKAGQLVLPTQIRVISDKDATALIDGGDGIGMAAGIYASDIAIEKAKKYGVGTVLIRNTNNVGTLSCYTQRVADENMIAIMSCNAAPAMAPWGGAEQFFGTNPISIAIPSGKETFVADMATSVVARGKIRKADRQNTSIPEGWALDSNGKPTTDPKKALDGTLLPVGGPKGSALAMAVDIISGLLSGSSYGSDLKSFHTLDGPTGVGASLIAVDIRHFMDIEIFNTMMDNYIRSVKTMRLADGFSEILIAGEIENRKELISLAEGVELEQKQITEINDLLKMHDLDYRLGGNLCQD